MLLPALASMAVVSGAVLLAIPLVVILALVLVGPAAEDQELSGRRRRPDAAQYLGS